MVSEVRSALSNAERRGGVGGRGGRRGVGVACQYHARHTQRCTHHTSSLRLLLLLMVARQAGGSRHRDEEDEEGGKKRGKGKGAGCM